LAPTLPSRLHLRATTSTPSTCPWIHLLPTTSANTNTSQRRHDR
jgi:hypothetical protein